MIPVPPQAIQIVKHFEGCELKAYQDEVGKWTISYGHTCDTPPDCCEGMECTQDEAEQYLQNDLAYAMDGIQRLVKVPLNDNQLSALISFAFNLGLCNLASSTLLTKLNSGDYDGAADEILRWDHAGGVVLKGLQLRRQAEHDLFKGVTYVAGN